MKKLILNAFLLISFFSYSQENKEIEFKFSVTPEATFFVAGDFASNYDFSIGGVAKYHFESASKWEPHLGIRYLKSFENTGASLNSISLLGGYTYSFSKKINRGFFTTIEGGVSYNLENFSFLLNNLERTTSINTIGFMAELDFGYQFSNRWSFTIGVIQLHTLGTGIKAGINFKF